MSNGTTRERRQIGLADPVRHMKEHVAAAIVARLHGWTQVNAAALLGTHQPRISDLRNGRVDAFSLDQLLHYAVRLEGVVRLEIQWSDRRRHLYNAIPSTCLNQARADAGGSEDA